VKLPALQWLEQSCATCGAGLNVRSDIPGPHYCAKHEGGKTMAKRKKKDFSEAIAASAEGPGEAKAPPAVRSESIVIRKVKHKVPVRIDDATAAAKGEQLAEVCEERLAVKAKRRETMAEFKERLGGLDERERELSASVKLHTEQREVLCAERLTPQNEVEIVRLDTGEIVKTRAAEAKDLQAGFGGDGEQWTEGPNPKPKSSNREERAQA
jgi:hypothetical protein